MTGTTTNGRRRDPWQLMLTRVVAALAASLLLVVAIVVPASAQDRPAGGGTDTSGDGSADSDDLPPDGFGLDLGAPADDGAVEEDPAPAAEGDGVVTNAVDDGDRSIQIYEIDNSEYPFVTAVVSVPPALAGDLRSDSFGVTEDDELRTAVATKLREVLEVVVVVDTSGSMSGAPLAAAKAAATEFVEQMEADTRVAVVGFGANAETVAGFDADREEALASIDGLQAGGETALYDALDQAAGLFADLEARRFVVVLSDGNDTASTVQREEASDAITGKGINFYAITLTSEDADFTGLAAITNEANGQLLEASDEDLSQVYSGVASRLTNLYEVRFKSDNDGVVKLVISVDTGGVLARVSDEFELSAAIDRTVVEGEVTNPTISGELASAGGDAPTGFLASSNALYLGAGILFLVIAGGLFAVFSRAPSGPSAFERLNIGSSAKRNTSITNITDRASAMADRMIDKGEKRGALDTVLEQAGIEMRPGEYLVTVVFMAFGAGAVGFALFGALFGLAFFGIGLAGGRVYVSMKAGKRRKAFANQLGDTLMMIAGSMRAGHGIVEAIDTVASQAPAPTGEEFSRAVAEARIGRDLVDSLYDIADRTGSEDFVWVVRAISINRELGGDLAEILDNVGETIRDRNRLRDQVRALSAEGKVSAIILFALPIGVSAFVKVSNPQYLDAMTSQTMGKVMVGGAVLQLTIGGLWLKKLVKVDF